MSEAALLEEGRARLARLEAQAAVAVPMPPATAPCFRVGSRGVTSPGRVGQCARSFEYRPSTSEETVARGFRPKHCRGGSVVDEMPATRNGGAISMGREADVSRLACVSSCGSGLNHLQVGTW